MEKGGPNRVALFFSRRNGRQGVGMGRPPLPPPTRSVAFAIATMRPTDATPSAVHAATVLPRESCFVLTSAMSALDSRIDSPLHVEARFSPRRLTERSARVMSPELSMPETVPSRLATLLPMLGAVLTDPCNVSATETDSPGASELRVVGT